MSTLDEFVRDHLSVSRRYFLGLGVAGAVALRSGGVFAAETPREGELAELVAKLEYLTTQADFGTVERGDPLPYTLPEAELQRVGLVRETWQLDVVPDPQSNAKVAAPMSRELGNALTFEALLKLAETKAVRFLKIMTCNNGGAPLGMGLWEGVPLRDVVWLTKPEGNVRRLFYHGYHNDDPAQLFQSSLPIGRVLEDPPGEHPVILCYKLNGEWISGKRGGPVRMVVPHAYGFKSVKWLRRVVLTNEPFANDTYANGNNDVDSPMKTFARFASYPKAPKAGTPLPITGVAQVGMSGLKSVQYWLKPAGETWPADDPHFTTAPWQDAEILPPPENWGGELNGPLPAGVLHFDPQTGRPQEWPQRYAKAHWAALAPGVAAGTYDLRCRTIDANGIAQPMPRPFPKSGRNSIESATIEVAG